MTTRTTIGQLALWCGLVASSGCSFGGDPVCSATVEYDAGQLATLEFNGEESGCTWATAAGQPGSSLRFRDSESGQLLLNVREPMSSSPDYTVDITVDIAGYSYRNADSQPCALSLSRYDIEDWTQYDRHLLNGTVSCAEPLTTSGDLADPVMLGQISFGMYSWNDAERDGL